MDSTKGGGEYATTGSYPGPCPGSPTQCKIETEKTLLMESCADVSEHLDDNPLYKREIIKRPYKTYRTITTISAAGDLKSFDDLVDNNPDYHQGSCNQLTECRCTFAAIYHSYKNAAIKIRDSKFIYILQFLIALLPISALYMGSRYDQSCPDAPSLPLLNSLTGILGILFVVEWVGIRYCKSDQRPCEDQQKIGIMLWFVMILSLMSYEIHLYCKMSPSYDSAATNYCSKILYDYTYYKYILTGISVVLGVLLYIPGCYGFVRNIRCSTPLVAYISYNNSQPLSI